MTKGEAIDLLTGLIATVPGFRFQWGRGYGDEYVSDLILRVTRDGKFRETYWPLKDLERPDAEELLRLSARLLGESFDQPA